MRATSPLGTTACRFSMIPFGSGSARWQKSGGNLLHRETHVVRCRGHHDRTLQPAHTMFKDLRWGNAQPVETVGSHRQRRRWPLIAHEPDLGRREHHAQSAVNPARAPRRRSPASHPVFTPPSVADFCLPHSVAIDTSRSRQFSSGGDTRRCRRGSPALRSCCRRSSPVAQNRGFVMSTVDFVADCGAAVSSSE
jgi:hypothetical protein